MPRVRRLLTNVARSRRTKEQPYASWTDTLSGFKVSLLKATRSDNGEWYASWHTFVRNDRAGVQEYGDTYVKDLLPGLENAGDLIFDPDIWSNREAFWEWAKGG